LVIPPGIEPVLQLVAPLADRFAVAGHRLHLVGGTVRDLFVAADAGRAIELGSFDIDATTSARPPEIKRCLEGWADAIWTQGERFGTIGAAKDHDDPATGDVVRITYEITTHRADVYDPSSRKPEVVFADHVEADLSRRDFTINAMAVDLAGPPTLVDPYGGLDDLRGRVLRTPIGADISFSDDPLRMLRAARFVSRLDLRPSPDVVEAIERMHPRLAIVSVERIRDEIVRLLAGVSPSRGLAFAARHGVLAHALPETAARAASAPEWWVDLLAGVDSMGSGGDGDGPGHDDGRLAWTRLAALLWGVESPSRRMRALRCSSDEQRRVVSTLELATAMVDLGDTAADVRRAVRGRIGRLHDALAVLGATGHGDRAERARRSIERLSASESLDDLGPGLDGATVMAVLGVGPGPIVGRALDHLAELRIVDGPLPADALVSRLRTWHEVENLEQ
jgi:poly(A) polymerase